MEIYAPIPKNKIDFESRSNEKEKNHKFLWIEVEKNAAGEKSSLYLFFSLDSSHVEPVSVNCAQLHHKECLSSKWAL